MNDTKIRCSWCLGNDLYMKYHDEEWGVPEHRDQVLFEFLTLEGAQAGLSWITILKRRANYRKAFANFNIAEVANFSENDYNTLLLDAGIIRNRLKIQSTITNAKQCLAIIDEFGSLNKYLWQFSGHKQINHAYSTINSIPATDEIASKISKELLKRGFRFVGPTICYSFMQATGMVNDHVISCYRYHKLSDLS